MKPDWPGLELDIDAGRNHHRLDIAAKNKGFVVVRAHVYSVLHGLVTAALERRVQRVPAEAGAFHAHREFAHAGQRGQLAEVFRHRRVVLRQHLVHFVEQVRDLGAAFALDRLAHQRCGGDGDRAALAVEAQVGDAIAIEPQRDVQPVAAQRVVAIGRRIGGLEPAEQPRGLVVIEDHVAIEVLEVHQPNTSRALAERGDQRVDVGLARIAGERRTRRGGHAEEFHDRHGAMVPGTHGHAFGVENGAEIVRMNAVDGERDHRGLVRRGADDGEAGDALRACASRAPAAAVRARGCGRSPASRCSRWPRPCPPRPRCSACRPRT